MKLTPEQLPDHLGKSLQPLYFVHGFEPLLIRDACDSIRSAARGAGYSERRVFNSKDDGWGTLLRQRDSQSLFTSLQLLEVRLQSDKLGRLGGRIIEDLATSPPADTLVMMSTGDLRGKNPPWYKPLINAGAVEIIASEISAQKLPGWIQARAQKHRLELKREAVQLLIARTEGNLLATDQELKKLSLLYPGQNLGASEVRDVAADSSRFNPAAVVYSALSGSAAKAVHALRGTAAEGTYPTQVIWAWNNCLLQLESVWHKQQRDPRMSIETLMSPSVWKLNKPAIRSALPRCGETKLAHMLALNALADAQSKGAALGDPWTTLADLCLLAADQPPPWLAASLRIDIHMV